jgi:hypothetical protein
MEIVLQNVIFCDSVVPLPDHKLACYGIFNELSSSIFPYAYPHFSVMTSWTNGKGFHVQQAKFLNPTRSLILSQSPEQYFTLENETETAYVTIDVNQIVFTEPGTYYFQVFLDSELVEEIPLHFKKKQ